MGTLTQSEIYEKVKSILVDALQVSEDEIKIDSLIHRDLGAESIDLLDIIFRLETEFRIKFPQDGLFPLGYGDNRRRLDGTEVKYLKEKMPSLDFSDFEEDPLVGNIQKMFTVKYVVDYVEEKLKEKGIAVP